MSAAHSGIATTWTPEQDALLGTDTDAAVGKLIGKEASTVAARRYRIGVKAFVEQSPHSKPMNWTPTKDRLLGTIADTHLARKLRCGPMQVIYRRRQLGIPRYRGPLGPRR